ncbi:DUF1206 domain-containing protein [uncultured Sulfitobacter sp.]|uniref:DUF1206 domain-containing protein n=1 Tax=uncultured Sulfitobacter sp. TaxID=191468 RepID=UPI00260D5174|nr:DUF1206 domain-containing protein [uncultured Sulfitobacter sp.]
MSNFEKSSSSTSKSQGDVKSSSDFEDYVWALSIMSIGYSGRGLVYAVIACVSFWSLWWGGEAEGTKSALESLNGIAGSILVATIAVGLFSFAAWRFISCFWDLEEYGTDAKGLVVRAGLLVIGVVHLGLGAIAIAALGVVRSEGQSEYSMSDLMQSSIGPWIVGCVGISTMIAGLIYLYKSISGSYRDSLQANHFTVHWNPVLRIGLAAQGISLGIIGGLILYAALTIDASKAGGLGAAFEWLHNQAYGRFLVVALCLGLIAFSLVCFVNAAYRIVPKASDSSVQNLTTRLAAEQA